VVVDPSGRDDDEDGTKECDIFDDDDDEDDDDDDDGISGNVSSTIVS
jgi:hypothetical protein